MDGVFYKLIPLLPFLAFLVVGLGGHWIKSRAHLIAVPAVLGSLLLSILALLETAGGKNISIPLYSWMTSGDLHVELGLYVDRLTAVMLMLVTIVSSLVHIYTIGYMHGDKGYARFFAYIALFTFSMLMLVMADNFLQLFVFWEAVGLCSYLLIGYWYERDAARAAGTKAFIVNRIGDFGFLLGLLLILLTFGSVEYRHVFAQATDFAGATTNLLGPIGGTWQISTVNLICVLLFIGAVGKSAQFPLHVWLPDAMEGPTPISALIHAATMVTAGVFMVARLAPLYNVSPAAMTIVAATGAFTMLLGASIALTQNDIKRIVAYSTVSQLGYMVMACGLGAYTAGIYHLLTHGAFKSLLFLAAGSVIIALHHEQDIRRMGGLKDKLPTTYWTMVIGSLALAGFPFTSGFFSKDEILVGAWNAGSFGKVLAILGLITAGVTAFYSFRLIFVVFWGNSRVDPHHVQHIHEPSSTMTIPLIILAILSIGAGYLGISGFLNPVFGETEGHHGAVSMVIMGLATIIGLAGVGAAYFIYVQSPWLADRLVNQWHQVYRLSLNKWYVDEAYDRTVVEPTFRMADRMWARIDVGIIDGAVNGVARAIAWWSWFMRLFQSGQTQHYALGMTLGAVLILTAYLLF
jgi:NADH-quinone oxidoreductase subunit L